MPNPRSDEEKGDFISRCMADPDMRSEFPESDQRAAVCYSKWDNKSFSEDDYEDEDYENGDEEEDEDILKFAEIDMVPSDGMAAEAKRGLAWREEYNRGGTEVGVARARDIKNKKSLSPRTIMRMVSYFARHEVDKKGTGWSPGQEGYPSAGRIAWALWGGDPGRSWANSKAEQIKAARKSRMTKAEFARINGAEIFAEGSWNGLNFSERDLDGIVDSFNALGLAGRVPLKLGHSGPDARDNPESQYAMGWVQKVYRKGKTLFADLEVPDRVNSLIKEGMLKFVSVELLQDVKASTRKIPWVLDAVALLGSDQPAVGTLKDLQSLVISRGFEFKASLSFSRADRKDLIQTSGVYSSMSIDTGDIARQLTELAAKNAEQSRELDELRRRAVEGETFKRRLDELSQQVQQDKLTSHRKRIKEIIENAVTDGRILPAARERFYRTHKVDTVAVLEIDEQHAREFVRENPNPEYRAPRTAAFSVLSRSTDEAPEDMQADIEALQRAQAFCRENGWDPRDPAKITTAVREIFSRQADLGQRYKLLPDEIAGRA